MGLEADSEGGPGKRPSQALTHPRGSPHPAPTSGLPSRPSGLRAWARAGGGRCTRVQEGCGPPPPGAWPPASCHRPLANPPRNFSVELSPDCSWLRGLRGPGRRGPQWGWGAERGRGDPAAPAPPQVGPSPGRPSVTELRVFEAPPAPGILQKEPRTAGVVRSGHELTQGTEILVWDLEGLRVCGSLFSSGLK